MSKQNARIRFLEEMDKRNGLFADLALFLLKEGALTPFTVSQLMSKPDHARPAEFYLVLEQNPERFHLVDWEWTVLPTEFMKLTIVTHNGVKEFVWTS